MLSVVAPLAQIPVADAIRVFNRNEVYLCLAAVITSVGLLAAAYSLLRRAHDWLLLWFALFAILYGLRLGLRHQPMWELGVHSPLAHRITVGLGYLVPIPAFLFFWSLGMLSALGRTMVKVVSPILLVLSVVTLAVGPSVFLAQVETMLMTGSLAIFAIELAIQRSKDDDTPLIRRGLIVFILCALYENVTEYVRIPYYNIEPFAFLLLLGALGMVAARRTLGREQQLNVLGKELQIAQEIQRSILPGAFPPSSCFTVATRYQPTRDVAGDFYDFVPLPQDQAGLLLADVSGHGVPAALIASMVKVVTAKIVAIAGDPAEVLRHMNMDLHGNVKNQFVTAAYAYLNAATGELRYAAAAHPPLLLLRGQEVLEIEENGLLLGAFDFAAYTSRTVALQTGDRMVMYTDGMLEAADTKHEEFGPERLQAVLRSSQGLTAEQCADNLMAAVNQWSSVQADDRTVLVCDYLGAAR